MIFQEIAVIAPGAMGSAVGARLAEHHIRVVTVLEGRSAASRARAQAAGMIGVPVNEIARADLVLSILPPGEAVRLAQTLAPVFERSAHKPIFADCNAVDVATVRHIGEIITPSGARFVDGGIIGGPPEPGKPGPNFHFSGAAAQELRVLDRLGVRTKVIDGPIGAASALKMSYAGINKGLIGIAMAIALAADRAGAGQALYAELEETQPHLLQKLGTALPDMVPKAYRWVAEMQEIAAFAGGDSAGGRLFKALAEVFADVAADDRHAAGSIDRFLQMPSDGE